MTNIANATATGLNPFEIRALVQLVARRNSRVAQRLNPFEIRALVQSKAGNTINLHRVSIPLKSGHWFNFTFQLTCHV